MKPFTVKNTCEAEGKTSAYSDQYSELDEWHLVLLPW